MLVMFFCFRHAFAEVPRPIAVKLGHMIGNCLNYIIQVQKFGGPPTKKIWGQKHAKFRSILYNLRIDREYLRNGSRYLQEAQLLLGDRATRKHAKDS